eukprot:CAMPEP_0114334166 /NCGR_PEP_ID=MMETSP0101-20121206/4196_1 /TAXON_ID=38822 ORGANISM="Pteridomonas danica, Strain PT" /NCGR_SAMPLE_ID=MMETSP0101 /ASSEMBLY_ACC=CAM_ASM_000211 /LENGTH=245 /DNA_ID=CAMNT_0001465339 /DNA_START=34 /DNA_END=771 /DNA_ORIENTATION=+
MKMKLSHFDEICFGYELNCLKQASRGRKYRDPSFDNFGVAPKNDVLTNHAKVRLKQRGPDSIPKYVPGTNNCLVATYIPSEKSPKKKVYYRETLALGNVTKSQFFGKKAENINAIVPQKVTLKVGKTSVTLQSYDETALKIAVKKVNSLIVKLAKQPYFSKEIIAPPGVSVGKVIGKNGKTINAIKERGVRFEIGKDVFDDAVIVKVITESQEMLNIAVENLHVLLHQLKLKTSKAKAVCLKEAH